MTIPFLDDFIVVDDRYYSFRTKEYELRLVQCVKGYDVELLTPDGSLLYPPECTNLSGIFTSLDAYAEALVIYTELLEQYETDRQNTSHIDSESTTDGFDLQRGAGHLGQLRHHLPN